MKLLEKKSLEKILIFIQKNYDIFYINVLHLFLTRYKAPKFQIRNKKYDKNLQNFS